MMNAPIGRTPRQFQADWAGSGLYHQYVWLKDHQPQLRHHSIPGVSGPGFMSARKEAGIAFAQNTFVVGTHGPI